MKTYRRLETPKLYANVYLQVISDTGVLSDSSLTDPSSSMQIIIEDSSGTVVQALADMTQDDTGKYSYASYTIPSTANTGVWTYECRATSGSTVATGRGSFEVLEEVA
jgi:uncharacterized protein YfaS (alpha-2-macroglobulin family)